MPAYTTLCESTSSTIHPTKATLNGSTFGQRREDIFNRLKNCAEQCRLNYAGKRELANERDDEIVAELCEALEETLSYGLRQKHSSVVVTAASLFQNMQEIVTGSSSSASSSANEITFWDFCQTHLTPHEHERFVKLKNVCTKLGRGRAFIRATLNENSLHRYLLTWLSSDKELQQYYTPWSLLLNEEAAKALPIIIGSLSDVLFALNVDTTELNGSIHRAHHSPLRQLKEEPIIYAPTPLPLDNGRTKRKTNAVERPIATASSTEDFIKALKEESQQDSEQSAVAKDISTYGKLLLEPVAEVYTTPIDPIEPELEFLKHPLPDYTATIDNGIGNEHYEDKSDTSSQYSKSSSSANCSTSQNALEEQLRTLNERCVLLETRVAQLSLENRQLVRQLTQKFNETGIDPSSSSCANFLITIPQVKLLKTSRSSSYYTYEIHITMRLRLEHWSLFRRYRDFHKLHKSLLRTHPAVAAVDFPPKKHFGNMNLVFVEERRQQLQIYLLNLVESLPQVEACKSKAELQKAFPFFRER